MPWIDCCIRSAKDQEGVDLEHIIQDGGSTDGTAKLCQQFPSVHYVQKKDQGMYDAINRGFKRAQGDIFLQLNCDEQLLPGALSAASRFFDAHPEVEIAFAYVLILNPEGNLLCYRKTLLPTLLHTQVSHLATLTCATFYRREAVEKHQLYFDTAYRVLGDAELICRALTQKVRMAIFPKYTAAFTITGKNLSNDALAIPERKKMAKKAPWLLQKAKPLVKGWHRIARSLGGVYTQGPLDYSVYTPASLEKRISFHVEKPDFRWKEL